MICAASRVSLPCPLYSQLTLCEIHLSPETEFINISEGLMIDEVCGGMLGTHLIIDSKTNEEEAICVYGDGVILGLILARLKVLLYKYFNKLSR